MLRYLTRRAARADTSGVTQRNPYKIVAAALPTGSAVKLRAFAAIAFGVAAIAETGIQA